ncbi:MAG: transcriptional coactivator p15 [Ignavibacteria bacterium]|jgi:hypothetical protein|nr:transcriptional coactivator p15 [Ignavibacteria bacterium]
MAEFKWDTEKLVGTVGKNQKGDEIQIRLTSLKGKSYVDVRTYYKDKNDELKPGKGISIPDDLADEVATIIMDSGSNMKEDDE